MPKTLSQKDLPVSSNEKNTDTWSRVLAKLRFIHGEVSFNSWLKHMKLQSAKDGQASFSVPTRFIREWIVSHYVSDICRIWREEDSSVKTVNIVVKSGSSSHDEIITQEHVEALKVTNIPNARQTYSTTTYSNSGLESLDSPLDPRFTFDNFIVGPSNELAHAAAKTVAESEDVIPGSNPLFLYGGVGLGKTHLMQAIAWHIRNNNPERRVIYLSAEKFMYQFIRALRNKNIVSFKEFFRSVDVLMVDDVQFICGKNSTQEEFFHTFNALIDNNRQLIISCDRSPSDLDGIEERIRSRLGWGLATDINSTTFELRLGILLSKVEQMNVRVPKEVLEFLARKISSNIRELEGALNKVIAHSSLIKREITIEGTQQILSDLLRTSERIVTVDDIKQTVAEHCNIRLSDMNSARRARTVARPRQMAMYLSKRLTTHSLPEIGRKFGGRDHTTVIHAVRKIEELCAADNELKNDIELLTRILQN